MATLDPFTPEPARAQIQALRPKVDRVWRSWAQDDDARVGYGGLALLLGIPGVYAAAWAGLPPAAWVALTIGPLLAYLTVLFTLLRHHNRIEDRLLDLTDRWVMKAPVGQADQYLRQIAEDITAVPETMRADFAPVMSVVRDCARTLLRDPEDLAALQMLADRAAAVRQTRTNIETVLPTAPDADGTEPDRVDLNQVHGTYDLNVLADINTALATVATRNSQPSQPVLVIEQA